MSSCRSCGAEITWARTPANKAMPLDAEPNPAGNVMLADGGAQVLGPLELSGLTDAEREELRMPHHATCPDGAAWKSKRAPS